MFASICASSPTPAITTKTFVCRVPSGRSASTTPMSIRRSLPVNAVVTECSRLRSVMSRLRASRFPVPEGSSAIAISVPRSPSATARTVPSPPAAITRQAPCSMACLVWPPPGSASLVSNHRVAFQPAFFSAAATTARSAFKSTLVGLYTTAATSPGVVTSPTLRHRSALWGGGRLPRLGTVSPIRLDR